jgi:hypothetical protein
MFAFDDKSGLQHFLTDHPGSMVAVVDGCKNQPGQHRPGGFSGLGWIFKWCEGQTPKNMKQFEDPMENQHYL